jgi:tRNA(adenine34) deaminase
VDPDRDFMALALDHARLAGEQGEVPVGAVLVIEGRVVAAAGNERERRHDPTAHAEMLVLRETAATLGGWRLHEATLYVTLEPCAMCAGAIVLARVRRLVYGADDSRAGAAGSVFNIVDHPALNHRPQVRAGLMAAEAAALLRTFFEIRRDGAEGDEIVVA